MAASSPIQAKGPSFPFWYKQKIFKDCAIFTELYLTHKSKNITSALAIINSTSKEDIASRQQTSRYVYSKLDPIPCFTKPYPRGLAVEVTHKSQNPSTYVINIDCKAESNRLLAIELIENFWLCHSATINTPEELLDFIRLIHALLSNTVIFKSGGIAYQENFREEFILFPCDNVSRNPKEVQENVRCKAPESEMRFLQLQRKYRFPNRNKTPSQTLRGFSDQDHRIFELGYVVPTDPKKIPAEMMDFCKSYLEKLKGNENSIDLAAWIHLEMIRILPFDDYNGHLARMLTNTELRRGGFPPFLIFDRDAYIKAQANRDPKEFRSFLERGMSLSSRLGVILEKEKLKPFKALIRS